MHTVKVHCEVKVVEVDGNAVDSNAKEKPVIVFESDWRSTGPVGPTFITITVGGKKYTVSSRDVIVAAKHASET